MREIKVRAPKGVGQEVARLAIHSGADTATITSAYNVSRGEDNEEVKIKTSSPTAKKILEALREAPFYRPEHFAISSHDILALISEQDIVAGTQPFCIPFIDIY